MDDNYVSSHWRVPKSDEGPAYAVANRTRDASEMRRRTGPGLLHGRDTRGQYVSEKVGANERCSCGGVRKFKHCCGSRAYRDSATTRDSAPDSSGTTDTEAQP